MAIQHRREDCGMAQGEQLLRLWWRCLRAQKPTARPWPRGRVSSFLSVYFLGVVYCPRRRNGLVRLEIEQEVITASVCRCPTVYTCSFVDKSMASYYRMETLEPGDCITGERSIPACRCSRIMPRLGGVVVCPTAKSATIQLGRESVLCG